MLGPEGVLTAENMRKLKYGKSKPREDSEKLCLRASIQCEPC